MSSTKNVLNLLLAVFPNPAEAFITISAENEEELLIELINVTGQTLQTGKILKEANQTTLNTESLPTEFILLKYLQVDCQLVKKY